MTTLLLAGLSNALVAAGIAALALAAGRVWKHRPALAHALWLLVLVKLLTPPVVSVPVEWTTVREVPAKAESSPPGPKPEPVFAYVAPTEQTIQVRLVPMPEPTPTIKEGLLDPKTGKPLVVVTFPAPSVMPGPMMMEEVVTRPAPARVVELAPAAEPEPTPTPTAEAPAAPAPAPERPFPWAAVALALWAGGALFWLAVAARRITIFHGLLRNAAAAPASLQQEFDALALSMGFRRIPRLRLIPGAVSPLVWAVGRATVYFPADLVSALDPARRQTLLAHELAHLRRRDHWVRWLELAAVSLYWWLPVAWLARRQLQRAEEECCDAWVMDALPGAARAYAAALLDTIDFLAEGPPAPAVASGIGRAPLIRQRLLMILHGTPRKCLPWGYKFAVLIAAGALLPLAPTLAQRVVEVEKAADKPAAASGPNDDAAAADSVAEPFAFEQRPTLLQAPRAVWWGMAVSPDGKTIASTLGRGGTHPGEILLWDVEAGKVRQTIREAGAVRCVAFSPDGTLLATGSFDNAVRLYEAGSGKLLAYGHGTIGGHSAGVNGLSFSGDGKLLATAGLDKTARLWDVGAAVAQKRPADGNQAVTMQSVAVFEGHPDAVHSVALAKDGKTLLTGGRDGVARLFDVPAKPKNAPRVVVKKEKVALKGHASAVEMVAISPDGKTFATGSWDTTARLWNSAGQETAVLRGHPRGVLSLAFSKDGKYVATGCGDDDQPNQPGHEVKLWEVPSGKKLADLGTHKESARAVAFDPEGTTLYSLGREHIIKAWSVAEKRELRTLTPPERPEEAEQIILALALTRDGKLLAVAGENKTIQLWDLAKKELVGVLTGHTDVVAGLAFSPDGKRLASAGHDKTVRVWDVPARKELHALKGHTNWVFAVAFAPDGKTVASGGYDKTVRLWDAATGAAKNVLQGHTAGVRSLAFAPEGDLLASAGSDRTVRLWDLKGNKEPLVLRGHKGAVRSVAFAPDGKTVASGAEDKALKVWDVADGKEVLHIGDALDMVGVVAYSPRGALLVSGLWNGSVQVWDAQTGKQRAFLNGHTDAVAAAVVGPDALTLITAGYDKTVRVWPATAPPPTAQLTFAGHTGPLWAVAASPDGKTLATGGKDGTIRLWDADSGKPKGPLPGHAGGVTSLHFSKDGKRLVSSGKDKFARLWDVGLLKPLQAIEHPAEVTRALISPDGTLVATACADKLVRLFGAADGKPVKEMAGHEGAVAALAFSPDGAHLASGGHDKAVILWNVARGEVMRRSPANPNNGQIHALAFSADGMTLAIAHNQDFRQPTEDDPGEPAFRNVMLWDVGQGRVLRQNLSFGHADWVTALAYTPDGKALVTTSRDGMVRFWDVESGRATQSFRGHQANVAALALTADGEGLFTAGEDRVARRWYGRPRQPLAERARLTGQSGQVWFAEFSPDGKLIANGGDDKVVRLRSAIPGDVVPAAGKFGASFGVAFSPDGKLVASAHDGGKVRIGESATGREVRLLDAHDQRVWSVAWSKDGKYLVSVSGNWSGKMPGQVKLWDATEWKLLKSFDGHDDLVFAVAFSPDGRHFATGGRDSTVRVFDAVEKKHLHTLKLHTGAVRSVAFSPDGKTLASAGFDNKVIFWDPTTGKEKAVHAFPEKGLCRVAFAPDGKTVAVGYNLTEISGLKVGRVLLCDAGTMAVKHTLVGHTGQLLDLAFAPDGQTLVTTGGRYNTVQPASDAQFLDVTLDGLAVVPPVAAYPGAPPPPPPGPQSEVKCWHVPSGGKLADLAGHKYWVEGVAFSRDGRYFATGAGVEGAPGEVRVWDAAGLRPRAVLGGHSGGISCGAFNRDGTRLVTGGWDKLVVIHDVSEALRAGGWGPKGATKFVLKGHAMSVRQVRFSPDGKLIASGSEDGAVKLWNAQTGELVRTIQAHSMGVYGLAFAPDGQTLATSAGDWKNRKHGEVKLWNVADGTPKLRLPDRPREVWSVAFTPDGKRLITGQADAIAIKVWDLATKKEIRQLRAPDTPRSLVISKDGKYLAAGLNNGQVKVWDMTNWQEVGSNDLPAVKKVIFGLSFAPDAGLLASAAGDGSAAVWVVPKK